MTIPFLQAKFFKLGKRIAIDLIVIHDMEYPERVVSAQWCAQFFTNPMTKNKAGETVQVIASCHYAIDSDSIEQCVLDKDIAYHAGPVNDYSIGIEHAGYANQTPAEWADGYSTAMLERSAAFVAGLCRKYSIPVRRLSAEDLKSRDSRGICGHVDVTNGLQGGVGHQDPGKHFPWDWYLARVRAYLDDPDAVVDVRTIPLPAIQPPSPLSPHDALSRGEVVVELGGVKWIVSPIVVAPIGIGQAADLAKRMGYELPSPALVDAIWRAADLRVPPHLMIRSHDGTPATMDAATTHAKQAAALASFLGARSLGTDFRLLAGAYKDVVQRSDGTPGIYGWHADAAAAQVLASSAWKIPTHAPATPGEGRVIQQPYYLHAKSWRDYAQGWRPCRRA